MFSSDIAHKRAAVAFSNTILISRGPVVGRAEEDGELSRDEHVGFLGFESNEKPGPKRNLN
jgi:hypothetical protein